MNIKDVLLKILAFLLGFKDESAKELEEGGRKIILEFILKEISHKINKDQVATISSLGAIPYSLEEVLLIKKELENGVVYQFSFPTTFDFEGDYIDFYQVTTKSGESYVFASCDMSDYMKEEGGLFLIKIEHKYPIENKDIYFLCK